MNSISKTELKKAREAIRMIAQRNSITEQQVREEMELAIDSGYNNPDPSAQKYWKSTPFANRKPSPEEFMIWCAAKANEQDPE